ncbi:MAG TPA: SUMF1/EgtB/PvdO family nonheme iron enzyme [Kiritimatiellia bacterium]|nr:SUMF1/EgtB/PvdO family nonheme iron enzyme [Kiritimatiellia bacterium]
MTSRVSIGPLGWIMFGLLGVGLAGGTLAAEVTLYDLAGSIGNHRETNDQVGFADEQPVHPAAVTTFLLADIEVTKSRWDEVRSWGLAHGYDDLAEGTGGVNADPEEAAQHPVVDISWHDAVKWCNARSEMEALLPVYRLGADSLEVYRTGVTDQVQALWEVSGYRLPTEREWELAAHGGLENTDFPWNNSSAFLLENITAGQARFLAAGTQSPGQFEPNAYGLYDMAGNVAEWCWDWYDREAYISPTPAGPDVAPLEHMRVVRGGSWLSGPADLRVSARGMADPGLGQSDIGFRPARTLSPTNQFGTIERFTATEENGQVVLRWWVSALDEIDGFRVSRLTDGIWTPVHDGLIEYSGAEAYVLVDAAALPGAQNQYTIEMLANSQVLGAGPFERTATPLQFVSPATLLPEGGVELRWESRPDEHYRIIRATRLPPPEPPEVLTVMPENTNVFVDTNPPPAAFYGIEMLAPPVPQP